MLLKEDYVDAKTLPATIGKWVRIDRSYSAMYAIEVGDMHDRLALEFTEIGNSVVVDLALQPLIGNNSVTLNEVTARLSNMEDADQFIENFVRVFNRDSGFLKLFDVLKGTTKDYVAVCDFALDVYGELSQFKKQLDMIKRTMKSLAKAAR